MVTKCSPCGRGSRLNPPDFTFDHASSASVNAMVSSRGRSPRKLKNTTASPSCGTPAPCTMRVGGMNSSPDMLADTGFA